jgi:uncharacterized protein YdiU (UPF0061 family)
MMAQKIGFSKADNETERLVTDLLKLMEQHDTDYTNTFAALAHAIPNSLSPWEQEAFIEWKAQWNTYAKSQGESLEERIALMRRINPVIIPRNHLVESILSEVELWKNDTAYLDRFHEAMSLWTDPYAYDDSRIAWMKPPTPEENRAHQTYCGT